MVVVTMTLSEMRDRKKEHMLLAGEKHIGWKSSVIVGWLQQYQWMLHQVDEKCSEREGAKVFREKDPGESGRKAEGQLMVEETGWLIK